MTWLTPPYYKPDSPVRVDCGKFFGSQPTAETMMQVLTAQLLGYPAGFIWGAAGSGADTPKQLTDDIVAYAQSLTESPVAHLTAVDFDPVARGEYYANLIIGTLKEIPAAPFNWMETGSVYDVWMRGKS